MRAIGCFYRRKNITIAATTAVVVSFNELMPETELAAWHFVLTGTANSLAGAGVVQYEFKMGQGTYLEMVPTEMRSLLEYLYSRFGGAAPATSDLTWTFPADLMAILFPDLSVNGSLPNVGIPASEDHIVEIELNASSDAGVATLGWQNAARPGITHYPYLVGHAISGLTASVDKQVYRVPWQPVPTAGLILTNGATDFTRMEYHHIDENGKDVTLFDITRDMSLLLAQPYSANAVTDPLVLVFGRTIIPSAKDYFVFDVGAGYGGAERMVPLQVVPVAGGVPGAQVK